MIMDAGIKLYYIAINALQSLGRRKGYFTSFVMIGLLFFLFFFTWNWIGFFSAWIDLENIFFEKAVEAGESGTFQSLIMLLTILKFGASIICFFLFLATLLYIKSFYRQKAAIEEEEILIKRLLGECSSIIALEFTLEGFYVLTAIGGIAIALSSAVFKRLISDFQKIGVFKGVGEAFTLDLLSEGFLLVMLLSLALFLVFHSVNRQADSEQLQSSVGKASEREQLES
ncbi:hypothetical protein I6N96_05225 [Enterococcus sp. BWM-S5]|uniref:FtsX-like permease family protein n=1 Tax=Enterococcus larvae TaxID=2794352 RepID=A0ABS4CHT5_9ENTE|nr:hypothetical protein [Enterococcus larvae]MBP1045671.1 hypothetical protein [Enterococcus larvae]